LALQFGPAPKAIPQPQLIPSVR